MSYNEQLRCDCLTTNHEGAKAWRMAPEWELYTTVVTTMCVGDKFYETGDERVKRIATLVKKVDPEFTAQLAVYAREQMHLRSVPMLLLVELSKYHNENSLVSRTVARVVQRADEITELLMCYQWRSKRDDLKHLSHQLRKGLSQAFNKFDEYQFAKYNRKDRRVSLRDALIIVHPKPKDETQSKIFEKIKTDTLSTPYTWETELSAVGQNHLSTSQKKKAKRQAWLQLIESHRLGYMATLRNLRNILKLGVDDKTMESLCQFLANPDAVRNSKQLPFRFLSAYIQLIGKNNIYYVKTYQLKSAQAKLKAQREKIEQIVEDGRHGRFLTPVRRVRRYIPYSAQSIGKCAKLSSLMQPYQTKIHSRHITWKMKYFDSPSTKNLKKLSRLEKLLTNLKERESEFDKMVMDNRILSKVMLNYGNNGIRVIGALEKAVFHTAQNIVGFDDDTRVLIASDTSGSMFWPTANKSGVIIYHIGLLLSMLLKHKCKNAVTGMFGDIWQTYDMPSENILQNTIEMISHSGEVGYSTNGHKVIDWLISEKRVMDKVMFFTDCQLWDSGYNNAHLATSWKQYKRIAPDAKLYIFDLAGYGESPVNMKREDVFCIAGWSDKVFDVLAALEHSENAIDEIRRIAL